MRTTKLGDLTVSAQGLGGMGMSQSYGLTDWDQGVAPAQVAMAWVYAQADRLGLPVVPIPGTKRVRWLEQNVAALDVTLTSEDLDRLDPLADQVVGARY